MKKTIKSKDTSIKWEPHKYQKKASKFLIDNKEAALFLDPGLGKTAITLNAIVKLKSQKKINRALIVAPLLVCYSVWPNEIKKWSQFNKLSVEVCHNKNKQKALKSNCDIMLINYEMISWLFSLKGGGLNSVNKIKKAGFDVLVFDELSKMKNSSSNRFKAIKNLLNAFKYRWGLTGSPAANGLMDLFGECFMLDMGKALGRYITHFRNTYFISVDPKGVIWKPLSGSAEKIFDKIKHLALRMKAEDYLDMPDIIYNNIYVELDKKSREIYDEMEKEFIIAINDKIVTAANAAVVGGKCRQICSGAIYTYDKFEEFDKDTFEVIHDLKIDALLNLIEELQGKQILVGYEFSHEKERLRKVLSKGYKAEFLKSRSASSNDTVDAWNKGQINILIGQPQSMGHGLNLQGSNCAHICWFTPTWNFELYDQFNRRIYRQGNKTDKIIVHTIIVKDTIDEVVQWALKAKNNQQNNLFNALVDYAKSKKIV